MLDWAIKAARKGKRQEKSALQVQEQHGGLVAGTLIATTKGWVPVERICVGDEVMTFDDGVQEVTGLTRKLHPMPDNRATGTMSMRPLLSVPAGLIGNRRSILLPEGQAMLVESNFAEKVLGDPFAAMDATELLGLPGVQKVLPEDRVVVVTLAFAEDQMIFVEGQALAHCPTSRDVMPTSPEEAMWSEDAKRYAVLSHEEAEMIVAGMVSTNDMGVATHPAVFDTAIS